MFQLYHTLNKNIQSTDLKKVEKEDILKTIDVMDQQSRDAFFLLIYEHARINDNSEDVYNIPYSGIETPQGIEFNLGKLPIKLRRILYKFVKVLQKNENLK